VATTRAQRRRRTVISTLILIVFLLAVLFARDINRSAHNASGPRRSENRSFGALASALMHQENDFDMHVAYLWNNGSSLSRATFAARMNQLDEALPLWLTEATQLSTPHLAHNVNGELLTLTQERVNDYQVLFTRVAGALTLPWTSSTPTPVGVSWTQAQQSLLLTNAQWNVDRFALAKEPGHVVMSATTDKVGQLSFSSSLDALTHSTSLTLSRGVAIDAVLVNPSPLPAASGELLLPPGNSLHLGVSVRNLSYGLQPVILRCTFAQTNGARVVQTQSQSATLGPLGSYAFVPKSITVAPGARGTLSLVVTSPSGSPGVSSTRHYLVIISASGNV
jgi:hypothetical protein